MDKAAILQENKAQEDIKVFELMASQTPISPVEDTDPTG